MICGIVPLGVAGQEIQDTSTIWWLIEHSQTPQRDMVGWYYAIEDLRQAVLVEAPQSPYLQKIEQISKDLRQELDAKKALRPLSSTSLSLLDQYRSGVLTNDKSLDKPCPQFAQLIDDWAFALDLPASLITATWLMESGCGRSRPANGDGIFQIVSKDYGTGVMTTGHRIWMVSDFNDFVRAKFARYHRVNAITTGFPMSYQYIDYTGVVKFGALYNGLSGANVRGDISPASVNYVFGKLNDQYSGAVKDGLLVRVMKVMKETERNRR